MTSVPFVTKLDSCLSRDLNPVGKCFEACVGQCRKAGLATPSFCARLGKVSRKKLGSLGTAVQNFMEAPGGAHIDGTFPRIQFLPTYEEIVQEYSSYRATFRVC